MRLSNTRLWFPVALAGLVILGGFERTEAAPKRLVKEFFINVAETEHEFYPGGPKIKAWAFN